MRRGCVKHTKNGQSKSSNMNRERECTWFKMIQLYQLSLLLIILKTNIDNPKKNVGMISPHYFGARLSIDIRVEGRIHVHDIVALSRPKF